MEGHLIIRHSSANMWPVLAKWVTMSKVSNVWNDIWFVVSDEKWPSYTRLKSIKSVTSIFRNVFCRFRSKITLQHCIFSSNSFLNDHYYFNNHNIAIITSYYFSYGWSAFAASTWAISTFASFSCFLILNGRIFGLTVQMSFGIFGFDVSCNNSRKLYGI